MDCNRRRFLQIGAKAALACLWPLPLQAAVDRYMMSERTLSLYNLHTDESLKICYFSGTRYRPEALNKIDYFLRDFRSGQTIQMDPRLLDILNVVSSRFGTGRPFHIISGYRSPETNAMLRQQGHQVAPKSYHLLGQAVDIRLPGVETRRLQQACVALKAGGVGYYPKNDFVHVDTGRVRYW